MMSVMERILLALGGVSGFLAVALGAFGAHGLKKHLALHADFEQRMAWWQTGAHYHLVHAVAVCVVALAVGRGIQATVAGSCFLAGTLVFSGSLYVMTLTGQTKLGAITPIGGVLLLVGWAQLAYAAYRSGQGG